MFVKKEQMKKFDGFAVLKHKNKVIIKPKKKKLFFSCLQLQLIVFKHNPRTAVQRCDGKPK